MFFLYTSLYSIGKARLLVLSPRSVRKGVEMISSH